MATYCEAKIEQTARDDSDKSSDEDVGQVENDGSDAAQEVKAVNGAGQVVRNSKVTFEDLPDTVVASVFSFVDFETLLDVVPRVCRRWRDLSRDPWAWDSRKLILPYHYFYGWSVGEGLPAPEEVCRILRIAPRLHSLHFYEDLNMCDKYVIGTEKILSKHPLPVRSLRVPFIDPDICMGILRLCERVEDLEVTTFDELSKARVAELRCMLPRLGITRLGGSWPRTLPVLSGLTHLRLYHEDSFHAGVALALIQANTSTLEVAHVPYAGPQHVKSIADCSLLQELRLPFIKEIGTLTSCSRLQKLSLTYQFAEDAERKEIAAAVQALITLGEANTVVELEMHSMPMVDTWTAESLQNSPWIIEVLAHFTTVQTVYLSTSDRIPVQVVRRFADDSLTPNLRNFTILGDCGETCLKEELPALAVSRPNLVIEQISCGCEERKKKAEEQRRRLEEYRQHMEEREKRAEERRVQEEKDQKRLEKREKKAEEKRRRQEKKRQRLELNH